MNVLTKNSASRPLKLVVAAAEAAVATERAAGAAEAAPAGEASGGAVVHAAVTIIAR